jgi:hypothetical protein
MDIKVSNFKRNKTGKCIGRADVQIGDVLTLRGVNLFPGKKGGHFITPPRREFKGQWYDVGFSFVYADGKLNAKSGDLYNNIIKAMVKEAEKAGVAEPEASGDSEDVF